MSERHDKSGDYLLAAYLDGSITDAQYDELVALLHAEPALLDRLAVLSQLDRMLADELSHTDRVELMRTESEAELVEGLDAVSSSEDSGAVLAKLAAMEAQAGAVEPIDFTEEYARRENQAKVRELARRRAADGLLASTQDQPEARTVVISKAVVWLALAAAIGLVAWVGWPRAQTDTVSPPDAAVQNPVETTGYAVVASIQSSVDARWANFHQDGQSRIRRGQAVTLTEGYAQVVFNDGATVIVQAPATFQATGPNGMRLVAGQITAQVPESAHGFTVATAGGLVTDHGTEFGVQVDRDGQTLAQTYTGLISIAPPNGDGGWDVDNEVGLRAGDAVVSGPQTGLRRVAAHEPLFVRNDEYSARLQAEESPYHRWRVYSYELRRDPALLAYYTFDHREATPDKLLNRSARTGGELDGTLGTGGNAMTMPRWVDGRFPEKDALRFGVVDQARARAVVVEGFGGMELGEALTLACWVRTPKGDASAGGTLLSLRDSPVRHLSFQFSMFLAGDPYPDQLQFGTGNELRADHPNENFRYSRPRTAQAGEWHLAAAVYDGDTVSFYMDGQLVSQSDMVGPIAVTRPDAALLIGTDPYMPNFNRTSRVEAFMGDIDEVAILDRAMSREEIDLMYQAGRPGR